MKKLNLKVVQNSLKLRKTGGSVAVGKGSSKREGPRTWKSITLQKS